MCSVYLTRSARPRPRVRWTGTCSAATTCPCPLRAPWRGTVQARTQVSANGFRCPLTQIAERAGAERGSVTDIYLPRWFAHNLPAIHVPLIVLAGYLHTRNLRGAT